MRPCKASASSARVAARRGPPSLDNFAGSASPADDDPRSAGTCGLAGAGRVHACGDGGDWCLLEAGLAHAGRAVPTDPGQRGAYQGSAGTQERYERCDLDCRSAGAWPGSGKLCAATADPRTARSDADEKAATREIVQHTQRIQAVLEEANVKLSSVITEILGLSGRRILKAIIAGEADPAKLSKLGGSRLAATRAELADALHGRIRSHHGFLIGQHLKTIEQLEETIAAFDARIEDALEPFRDTLERLRQVPGLSTTWAQILIAEIGADMRQFLTAGHLLSWAV